MTLQGAFPDGWSPVGSKPVPHPHKSDSSVRWRAPTLRERAYSNGTVEAPEGIP